MDSGIPASPGPRLTRGKRIGLIILGMLAVLLVLSATLLPALIRGKAVEALKEATGREVRIDKISLNPLTLTAAVQERSPDAPELGSVAKTFVGERSLMILQDCVQIHGGIGVTWEHDIHLYLRRAVSNEQLWGSPAAHHERLCQLTGL